jgi:oligopeptide/dipeptide ABC transporter ATP-binding protein
MTVLSLRDVSVEYGPVSAVSGVSLDVAEGEIFALVGESGCGKTTLALAVMGLLPASASVSGTIEFLGRDLTTLSEHERGRLRGDRISMIFQDPGAALDPAFSVGDQVAETIRAHRSVGRREAKARALQLLREVGIPDAERRYADAPHRFSGGMQQRIVIATALANEPALLIADEPTTALDVTIQAQILGLMRELRRRHSTTILLIAHNFGVVAQLSDRAGVLYGGQLVEIAPVRSIFAGARHPYTSALLAALPSSAHVRGRLATAPGAVPDLADPPPGCRFAPRCPVRLDVCVHVPPLARVGDHMTACWARPETQAAASHRETVTVAGGET